MNTNREQEVEDQRDGVAGEELADVLQLAHARDGVADPARLEVGERQVQQVAEQARAEFDVDAAGGVREDVAASVPRAATSKTTTTSRPPAMTSSVVRPRCTSTLSITTWKNSGVTSAKSCRTKETSSTSPSNLRYLTTAGMNQLKSNRASSPASDAREVNRIRSPLQRAAKSAVLRTCGRGAAGFLDQTP
jgi:hypothetical protein